MERKDLPPFWVIFGVGVVVVASVGFVLMSLANGARVSGTEATLTIASQVPAAPATPVPATSPATRPSSPLPTLTFATAPDFTLERPDGSAFTLAEHLAQGPVVLVFIQRCST
jgi:hypothetical protein